jgi:hypothetical protein
VTRFVEMNGWHDDMRYTNKLCAQNVTTVLGSIMNTIKRAYVYTSMVNSFKT